MIPKARLDALTDGIFAFAMTLLVLNLELPGDFRPASADELLSAFGNLSGPLLAYVITFYVLARRWMGQARTKEDPEIASGAYAWTVIVHLFFITLMPFSTMVVGEHSAFAPAIWLYAANMIAAALAANMIAAALAAIVITYHAERETGRWSAASGRPNLVALIGTALLSVAISLVEPGVAMWAYLLNAAVPVVGRWAGRK